MQGRSQRVSTFRTRPQLRTAAMSDADKKALKVKTGVVKRLRKELDMYQKEVQTEQAKVQKLKDAGADPHDIKYAVRQAAAAA